MGCAILICTDAAALEARFGKIARERFAVQDTAAAATQILQCATALGLSGCWMGAFDHDNACAYFGVPDGMEPVILLGIGHAVSEPPARPRKPLDEVVTLLGDCGEAVSCSDEPKPYTLRGSMLPGAVFADLHLADASFHNINMAGARFTDINLTGASFGGLCMNETSFGCVDMKNASFENPDLTGTAFRGCTLRNVKLENCDIGGMTIDGIDVAALIEKAKQEQ